MEKKPLKKITKVRLKNIGLFYLQRFESSVQNLREVLKRRVFKYAFENPDFDVLKANEWIEEILVEFQNAGYLCDERFAELKVRDYVLAGKPARYIKTKLKMKGISEDKVEELLENEDYDPFETALNFARKKKIGPYRIKSEDRKACFQKDLGTLVRAGFDYDIALEIMNKDMP